MHKYLKGKRLIGIIAVIVLTFLAIPHIFGLFMPSGKWALSEQGLLAYPQNRGDVEYTSTVLNDTSQVTRSKIIYKSKEENIYALLRVPKTPEKRKPAIILLPGAGVSKEGEDSRAAKFAEWGYVTLTLDERGNTGETGGGIKSMDEEFALFLRNEEPVTHKMVFDVLRAYDFLAERDDVDSKNIIVFGESMGGRFAIMAAAIEPRIKAVVGVSTSGYDSPNKQFQTSDIARFFKSIDPDAYIAKISPRNVLMIHSTNDATIPIEMARPTFSYAGEPKKFITVACNTHGWCGEMEQSMKEEFKNVFAE